MRIDAATGELGKPLRLSNPPQSLAATASGVYVAVRSNGREHRGGTLRISGQLPDFLDPALAYSTQAWAILEMTNDGLVGLRRVSGVEGVEVVPDLAVSLPSPTDDGRTYTFRLRPGIRYSTGRLVEPADIRRALERVFEARPPSPGRQYYDAILGARRCQPGRGCNLARGIVTDDAARTVTSTSSPPTRTF